MRNATEFKWRFPFAIAQTLCDLSFTQPQNNYFTPLGLRLGLFPGVSLLSRRRLSTFPVDLAIGFGPGFNFVIAYTPPFCNYR